VLDRQDSNLIVMNRSAACATLAPRDNVTESSTAIGSVDDVIRQYQRAGRAPRWPLSRRLETAIDVVYRNGFIQRLAQESVPKILESYVYFSVAQMEEMLALASRYLLPGPLRGVGLDLGAGSGLLASVVARQPPVDAVLAIEVCEQAADLLIPKVASWVLANDAGKVVPVVGSFDDLRLPDASIDFAVEIDSFHHSDDLPTTFGECARVLKPGGWLVCFDRVWPNAHPDHDLRRLLSLVYSPEYLSTHGFPSDMVLTRKDNGEHEYKLFEWQAGFEAAGLELVKLCKFRQKTTHRRAVKGLLSVFPTQFRRLLYQTDNATFDTFRLWLAQQWKVAAHAVSGQNNIAAPEHWPQRNLFAPRDTSVLLLRKLPG
jgi:SAM-dependent methyltransferase